MLAYYFSNSISQYTILSSISIIKDGIDFYLVFQLDVSLISFTGIARYSSKIKTLCNMCYE